MVATKKTWKLGSVFSIQLSDGSYTFGQVLEDSKHVITAGFFDVRTDVANVDLGEIKKKKLYSILEVTTNHLAQGKWKVIGTKTPVIWQWSFPNFVSRLFKGGVGSASYTSPLVQKFIEAYFGLLPWNHFAKMPPDYFDGFLWKRRTVSPKKVLQ